MEPTLRGINPQPQPQSRVTAQARPPCLPGSLLTCVAGCCVARPRSRRRIKGSAGRDKNFFHMSASKLHGKPEAAAEGQCPSQQHGSRLQGGLPHSLPRVPRQLINEGTATLPLPCCAQPRCQLLAWGFMPMSWPPTAKTLLLCNRREQAGSMRIVISKESAWMGIKWEDFRLFSSSLYVHCLTRPLHHSSECS